MNSYLNDNPEDKQCYFSLDSFSTKQNLILRWKLRWVIPEKIHTPKTEGMLENLTGGGVNGSGNPLTGEGSEPKNTSSGVTFDFIDVSIASIDK